jgi:hypothetical protein
MSRPSLIENLHEMDGIHVLSVYADGYTVLEPNREPFRFRGSLFGIHRPSVNVAWDR